MKKKKKGFTLVEAIVTITITLLVVGIIFTMSLTNNRILYKTEAKSDLQGEADNFFTKVTKIGSQAVSLSEIKTNGLAVPITNSSSYSELMYLENDKPISNMKLAIPKDNLLEIGGTGDIENLEINFINKTIILRKADGTEKTICENVEELSISLIDIDKVPTSEQGSYSLKDVKGIEIKIKFSKKRGKETVNYEISNKVYFRNNQYKDYV